MAVAIVVGVAVAVAVVVVVVVVVMVAVVAWVPSGRRNLTVGQQSWLHCNTWLFTFVEKLLIMCKPQSQCYTS